MLQRVGTHLLPLPEETSACFRPPEAPPGEPCAALAAFSSLESESPNRCCTAAMLKEPALMSLPGCCVQGAQDADRVFKRTAWMKGGQGAAGDGGSVEGANADFLAGLLSKGRATGADRPVRFQSVFEV